MFFKRHLTVSRAREIFEEIESQAYPDVADLKRLVDFHKEPIGTYEELQALELKYQAMTYEPTTIEKTMTPAQLYDAACPLWAIHYSVEQLSYYFMLDHWPYKGQGIIDFMEQSVVPMISAQVFTYPSSTPHRIVIHDEPRRKGTVQVPPILPPQ